MKIDDYIFGSRGAWGVQLPWMDEWAGYFSTKKRAREFARRECDRVFKGSA